MEENGSRFILIESDNQGCMDKRNCKLSDEIPTNVSALWMVEMIRHRNPNIRGHAKELKLTVFPIKLLKGSDSNSKREAKRYRHPHPQSFVITDKDYPVYFVNTALSEFIGTSLPTSSPIQKRTFDVISSLTENTFENYNVPLHFNYNGNEQLNTGELYTGSVQDVGPTAPSYPKYGNSITPTTYQTESEHVIRPSDHYIRFPTTEGITGPSSEHLDRISTTPLTATHLHHHFYLNRNHLLNKGHLYDNHAGHQVHDAYNLENLQLLHENSAYQESHHNQHSTHNIVANNPPINHQYLSSLIKFPSGSGSTPSYQDNSQYTRFPTPQNHQVHEYSTSNYDHPKQLQFTEHPQIAIPPVPQSNGYYNQPEIPLTTAAGKFYAPFHLYPATQQVHPRLNHQQILLHPASPTAPFQGNYQLDNNHYSELDPIYHQQLSVLSHHLTPHILAHQDLGSVNGIQHHRPINVDHITNHGQLTHTPGTLDVIPLNNQGIPITPSSSPVLSTGSGGYEVPSEKLILEPEHNSSKYDQLPSPSGGEFANGGFGPSQEGYPDSINAQLPPPKDDEDINVPYVDSTVVASQTSSELADRPKPIPKIRQKNRNPDAPRKKKPTTTTTESFSEIATTQNTVQSTLTIEQIKRLRNRGSSYQPKATTEKAILKWMPKRNKLRVQNDVNVLADVPELPNSSSSSTPITTTTLSTTSYYPEIPATSAPVTSTAKVFIVTPTQVVDEDAPMTSISTSISYKVGDEEHRTVSSNEAPQSMYHGFLPTIAPPGVVGGVVDVIPGKLARINTNLSTVTLFRTSDERDDGQPTSGTTVEEQQIARTILKHADALN